MAAKQAEGELCGRDAPSRCVLLWMWWPFLLGHALEWYEYGIFGYLTIFMKDNFFGGSSLATWFGFAMTFVGRPLGGVVLGRIADVAGRRKATLLSMTGMLVATVGQGLLPSYVCCGDAAGALGLYVLMGLRFLQGLSAGGEMSAVAAYVAETAPRRHLAVSMSTLSAIGVFAFLLADGVALLSEELLGQERMVRWGWRLPFLASLGPGLLSLWGRLRLPETEEFLCEQRRLRGFAEAGTKPGAQEAGLSRRAVAEFCTLHGRAALVGFGASAGIGTTFYVGLVWCPAHLKEAGMDPTTAGCIGALGNAVALLTLLLAAHLGDVVGIGYCKLLGFAGGAVLGVPLFAALAANPNSALAGFLCVSLGCGLLGGLQGSAMLLFCAELFPAPVRALGFGLSYNLSVAVFGGLGGVLAEASLRATPLGPGLLLSCTSLLSLASVVAALLLQSRGALRLSHVRGAPLLRTCRSSPRGPAPGAEKAGPGTAAAECEAAGASDGEAAAADEAVAV